MNRIRAQLPAACLALLLLASPLTGCRRTDADPSDGFWPSRRTTAPTTSPTVDDPAYASARDAALAHMRQAEPTAPPADAAWDVADATPEGALDAKTLRYTAADWVVEVSAPIIAPGYQFRSLYRVSVANAPAAIAYECRVTADGLVYEAPLAAIDALLRVIAYLQQSYPEVAPVGELAWLEQRATPEGLVGAMSYRYAASPWDALVSYAITSPEQTVYTVELDNDETGYRWRGEVHPDGTLVEVPPPVATTRASLTQSYADEEIGYSLRYPFEWTLRQPTAGRPLELTRDGALLSLRIRRLDQDQLLLGRPIPSGTVQTSGVVTVLGREVPRSVVMEDESVLAVMYSIEAEELAVSVDLLPVANGGTLSDALQAEADAIARSLRAITPVVDGPVEGWIGTVVRLRPGHQHSRYFQREDGLRFDISAGDEALRSMLEEAAWSGASIQIWGTLELDVIGYASRLIDVDSLAVLDDAAHYPRDLTSHAAATATSALPADRWGQYDAAMAIDGLPDTAWTENASDSGIGEALTLTFPGPITVTRVGILPGWDHPDGYWSINNRLKRATLRFDGGESVTIAIEDLAEIQYLTIDAIRSTTVALVIEEVYPGSRYDDTCVGEMVVWGMVAP